MSDPISIRNLHTILGHIIYYHKIIRNYPWIITPLEKLLRKETRYIWTHECEEVLDLLKGKLVIVPILIFSYWKNLFHVHVDGSFILLCIILAQPREGYINHQVSFQVNLKLFLESIKPI